jgi:glycosyltransferase involved in cell wall biosynthesis
LSGLVSIVMPMHNDEKYIGNTLQSVLCQTYSNFEVLIVDDASSDDSLSIIKNNFHDDRIKIFRNEVNKGAAYSRNVALKNAYGKWIAFLDADDYWFPSKLEEQVNFMEHHGYHFSYTQYYEAGDDLQPKFLLCGPSKINRHLMLQCGYMGCLTVMYERNVIGALSVDEDIKKRNDYALWILASGKATAYLLKRPLAIYRRREGGISSITIKQKLDWTKKVFLRYVTRSHFYASLLALRVGLFTVFKNRFYRKRLSAPPVLKN